MNINVIAISVEAAIEHKWCVHEAARINQTTSLTNLHFLHIEDKAAIEDMEGECTFTSEEQDLVVSDLMGKAHVARHPVGLVDLRGCDFLPDIARDVINFYCVNNSLLIHSSTKCEDVIVLKDTQGSSSARDTHIGNEFPLILLRIVHFTVSVDLVADKRANDVNEVLNGANNRINVELRLPVFHSTKSVLDKFV